MTDTSTASTRQFQAEARQLLHLMTHSLYSNREIFVRELISNAADACDKLRYQALKEPELLAEDAELKIRILVDEKKKTLTFIDSGIGMNMEEVHQNIGTIASSGTAKFFEQMTGDERKDSALIGQFGVGFYSAFIVAKQVEIFTRKAGLGADQGVHWSSTGDADYIAEPAVLNERGTRIVLHLKNDAKEFLDAWRLKGIVRKYSEHIATPIQFAEAKDTANHETLNSATALWTRPRNEIAEDDYRAFYRQLSHDFADPLLWSHNRVEGRLDYTSLLFVPARASADLWRREGIRGLKLYIRRTFVLDDAEQFLPPWLRFIKGVLDANDLPLNVSRELLQDAPQVEKIRTALTKRVLDLLAKTAKSDGETYQKFWNEFGSVIKEGLVEGGEHSEKLLGLLRCASTLGDAGVQNVSLQQYLDRMPEGQEKIYFLTGDSSANLTRSPLLESFRKAGTEVLLLADPVDEWVMSALTEFQGKHFQDVARGDLDQPASDAEAEDKAETSADAPAIVTRIKDVIEEQVSAVRVSRRLVDSPSCLVLNEFDMGHQMRRVMQASGQQFPEAKPVLEINPTHPLIQQMEQEANEDRFADFARLLLDNARIAGGELPLDSGAYLERLNRYLLRSPE